MSPIDLRSDAPIKHIANFAVKIDDDLFFSIICQQLTVCSINEHHSLDTPLTDQLTQIIETFIHQCYPNHLFIHIFWREPQRNSSDPNKQSKSRFLVSNQKSAEGKKSK